MIFLPRREAELYALLLALTMPRTVIAEPLNSKRSVIENEEVRDAAARAFEAVDADFKEGFGTIDEFCHWSHRWMEAERAASKSPRETLHAVRAEVARLREIAETKAVSRGDAAMVTYYLAKAETLLASLDPKERARIDNSIGERRRLQGDWKVRTETRHGKLEKESHVQSLEVRERVVTEYSSTGSSWGFLSLDPTASPKTFNYRALNEDYMWCRKDTYRLEGDLWTITLPDEQVITLRRTKGESK